ncbi:unnamed protein product [Nesidiocoris tenuis]|uniref:Uncharacterized protein n=1 Tax=Nesidiocoris tenuis TaxID=355587 RepID=A0A6H5GHM2_9HEMI|nr:unnamed protein product [Nesidiocoris tenuis]
MTDSTFTTPIVKRMTWFYTTDSPRLQPVRSVRMRNKKFDTQEGSANNNCHSIKHVLKNVNENQYGKHVRCSVYLRGESPLRQCWTGRELEVTNFFTELNKSSCSIPIQTRDALAILRSEADVASELRWDQEAGFSPCFSSGISTGFLGCSYIHRGDHGILIPPRSGCQRIY